MCLAVDPSAYTKAGLTVPKDGYATWDDLGKDLVKLKAALGSGSYGADDVLWLDTVWGYWCEQHGEHAYTSKGDNIGFTQKTYVDYMNLVKSWMTQGLIPPLDVATTAASDPTNSELAKHKSAMDIIYTNNFENLQKAFGSTLQIVSLPGPNAAKATGVLASQHFVMSSKSANKDEAAKFISYFVNNVDANKVLNAERGMPASTEVLTALRPTFTSNQQAVSDYLEQLAKTAGAVPPPAPANSQSIYTLMDNLTQQIIYGKTTAEAAYQQIASTAKSQLASK